MVLGQDHPKVATMLNNLAGVTEQMGDYLAAARLRWRALTVQQQQPPNFAEDVTFFRLGKLAAPLGRPDAGLRLLATTYVVASSGMPMPRSTTCRRSGKKR